MPDMMDFPQTFDEFAERYKIVDKKEVYTNGTALIPIFRVNQWLDHVAINIIHCKDCKHGQQVGDLGVVCEYGCEEYRPFDHFCAWGERRDFASDAEDE